MYFFFFSSRRRHTRCSRDWSSDVCSSDLERPLGRGQATYWRACIAALLGERDTAVDLLARAFDAGYVYQVRFLNAHVEPRDRKSTRLNSSHGYISYAVFCLKKKKLQLMREIFYLRY